jgi:signal transduction histidine kinase
MLNPTEARKADVSTASETDMTHRPVRVLLVEDDEDDYRLTRDLLREIGERRFVLELVMSYDAAVEAMTRQEHDVYLVDYRLGMHDGLELLREPFLVGKPVIMLTGLDDSDVDLKAMAAGAADYLVKGKIDAPLLERSIRYAIERKRAEESLKNADRRKEEFLATLAHELRSPLAPIRNGLQLMKLAKDDAVVVEQARTMMERQLGHLVRLVDDLLDVNRINLGKLELRKEPIEMASVVREAVEISRPLIEACGHELTVTLPPEPVYLDADLTRLAQVFSNLLNNAAKYSEPGGRIWLSAERQGNNVVVTVKDMGVGIPAEMLPKVFDMFTQVDRTLDRSQAGLGIGLSLVKNLVEMHGGCVEARSDGPGNGSEFVVRLTASVEKRGQVTQSAVMRQKCEAKYRILVVDDNRDTAGSLAMILQMMGNDTRTAYDGEEAVAAASEFQPDVILLDLELPKLDGYEACRRIRKQPGGKELVIIAQTGYGQAEDRRRTHQAGFDYHIVKPLDPDALLKLLAEFQQVKPSRLADCRQ